MAIFKLTLSVEEVGYGEIYSKAMSIAENEDGWQQYMLANGTTDQAIPFNLTTGVTPIDLLLITSDYAISWRQAVTDTAIALDAGAVHCLWGTNMTAILVTNASGSTARVQVFVAGT